MDAKLEESAATAGLALETAAEDEDALYREFAEHRLDYWIYVQNWLREEFEEPVRAAHA